MRRLLWLPLVLASFACKQTVPGDSSLKTDLGREGNAYVKSRFDAYQRKTQNRCSVGANATGKRAIVTGFGPFGGTDANPSERNRSGVIVRSMASEAFWPSEVSLATIGALRGTPDQGRMPGHDGARVVATDVHKGGYGVVRALTIDGERYQVCFLLLDVVWDLASAIIVTEARSFGAEAVLMMGTNPNETAAGTFEKGAVNRATNYQSFDADGRSLTIATPKDADEPILPPASLPSTLVVKTVGAKSFALIESPWSGPELARATEGFLEGIAVGDRPFTIHAADEIDPGNDYVCNNVTFVTLNGLAGRVLSLAGGELVVPAAPPVPAKAGFLHVPAGIDVDSPAHVGAWAKVVAGAVKQLTR